MQANSQWRKVQDCLEDDKRCSSLEKIDCLLIFQDYIHDLEKEEEEKRKMQKVEVLFMIINFPSNLCSYFFSFVKTQEQLRRAERKNRDAFRKLMEDHVADGILTAKTYWRDYCLKVFYFYLF